MTIDNYGYGTDGSDRLVGRNGNDWIEGRAGNDRLYGLSGNDSLFGGAGNDYILGGSGHDWLEGGDGNDRISGGSGDDVLFGGAGSDELSGGSGNDTFGYVHDQAASRDRYNGGSGYDNLQIYLTYDEWDALGGDNGALAAELASFGDHLERGRVNHSFTFASFDLTISRIEEVSVYVYGEPDQPVVATDDEVAVAADDEPLAIDVLENDSVADGVETVVVVDGPALGTATVEDNRVVFDAGEDFAHLAAGETETVSLTYAVVDTDGDSDEATVSVVVTGDNDAPETADVTAQTLENASNVEPFGVADGERTVVNAGGFYVLDTDSGELTFLVRGLGRLTPDEVAPENGIVVYLNPNTTNWFAEAHSYSGGEGTSVDPASFTFEGYDGETLLRDASYYLLETGSDITLTIDVPSFDTPTGAANATVTLTGLGYDGTFPFTVDVDDITIDVEPAAVEGGLVIAPDAADVDGEALTITFDDTGLIGTVTLQEDGTFLYDQGAGFGYLAQGEVATDTFTYTATDAAGLSSTSTITVEITGTNDAPTARALEADVFAEAPVANGFEAGVDAVTIPNAGMFYILDLDTGEMTTQGRGPGALVEADVAPANGLVLLVNPNTNSTYLTAASYSDGEETIVDPSELLPLGFEGEFDLYEHRLVLLDAVSDGTVSLAIDGLVTPGGPVDAEITLTGFDYDGPYNGTTVDVAGAAGGTTIVPVETSVTVAADVFDLDDETFTFTLDTSSTLGSVVNNGDGTFTYEAAGAFDGLDAGEVGVDTFRYTVTDGSGAFDIATVTINTIGVVTDDFTV